MPGPNKPDPPDPPDPPETSPPPEKSGENDEKTGK